MEEAYEGLEIFHVRTEDEGFVGEDGLGWVLSTGGEEGFPDDDDIGMRGPGRKLTGGVDHENSLFGLERSFKTGSQSNVKAGSVECLGDFVAPLGVAGDDDRKRIGIGIADGGGDQSFLAGKCGSGEDDGSAFFKSL